MKLTLDAEISDDHVDTEEAGRAKIWTSPCFPDRPGSPVLDEDPVGVFVRLQSWDEHDRSHELFNRFVGKRVRITIESLDPLDRLADIPKGDE
ncbi:MAG: hypothetical protein AB7L09_01435 [Nitrospira sp.]